MSTVTWKVKPTICGPIHFNIVSVRIWLFSIIALVRESGKANIPILIFVLKTTCIDLDEYSHTTLVPNVFFLARPHYYQFSAVKIMQSHVHMLNVIATVCAFQFVLELFEPGRIIMDFDTINPLGCSVESADMSRILMICERKTKTI